MAPGARSTMRLARTLDMPSLRFDAITPCAHVKTGAAAVLWPTRRFSPATSYTRVTTARPDWAAASVKPGLTVSFSDVQDQRSLTTVARREGDFSAVFASAMSCSDVVGAGLQREKYATGLWSGQLRDGLAVLPDRRRKRDRGHDRGPDLRRRPWHSVRAPRCRGSGSSVRSLRRDVDRLTRARETVGDFDDVFAARHDQAGVGLAPELGPSRANCRRCFPQRSSSRARSAIALAAGGCGDLEAAAVQCEARHSRSVVTTSISKLRWMRPCVTETA